MKNLAVANALALNDYALQSIDGGENALQRVRGFAGKLPAVERCLLLVPENVNIDIQDLGFDILVVKGQGIGQLLRSLGWFCTYRSRNQEAKEFFQQAREQLAPDPGDEPHLVWARILAGEIFARPSEVDRAQIERSLAIAQQYGHRGMIAVCLRIFGEIALNAGDYAEALSLYEEGLAHFRDLDNSFYTTELLYKLAEAYRLSGQSKEAIKFARQSHFGPRSRPFRGRNYKRTRSFCPDIY